MQSLNIDRDRCPSQAELLEYFNGDSSGERSGWISKHLLACSDCKSQSDRLVEAAGSSVPNQFAATVSMGGSPETPRQQEFALAFRRRIPRQLGPYRLISLLGSGGMGMVFKANHTRLKRLVAIKVLPPSLSFDAGGAERLQREIEAAGAVQHPNVVYSTDAGEDQEIIYLVMEYVEGIDLGQLVARRGALPLAEACEIGRQAAIGLAHLHERHLVHRDLKPTNLMLSAEGIVKILDLGLARFLKAPPNSEELTGDDHMLGTADYMSPEQAINPREVDARSDIYSLGCTLFKLLAGRAPFSGEQYSSFGAKVLAHRQVSPPSLADLRADLPVEVAQTIASMLAKSPFARPQSASAVAEALAPWAVDARLTNLIPPEVAKTQDISAAGVFADELLLEPSPAAAATPTPGASHSATRGVPRSSEQPANGQRRQILVLAGLGALLVVGGVLGLRMLDRPPTYEEIAWPGGGRGKHSLIIDPVRGTVEAHSETPQFIRTGAYRGGKARVRIRIDQASVGWRNDAGVFLGYREIPHNGEYAARAQLIKIARMDRQIDKSPPRLVVFREVTIFDPRTGADQLVRRAVDIPWPGRDTIALEVDLEQNEVTGIRCNGRALDALLVSRPGEAIPTTDTTGQVGLYNHGLRGSWFSELVFEGIHP